MNKLNQKGIAHIFLLLILLVGIVGGVWLVVNGNPLKLFSKASNPPIVFKSSTGQPLPIGKSGVPVTDSLSVKIELTSTLGSTKPTSAISAPVKIYTLSYRIAEDSPAEFSKKKDKDAGWIPYTQHPTVIDYTFNKDSRPGQKFIWVEFKNARGETDRVNARIEITKPSSVNKITWSTPQVSLGADNFYIMVNGKKFLGSTNVSLHSDPGNSKYTTLEAIWQENGVEMRMNMYFSYEEGKFWKLTELRTYNGRTPGDWIYYNPKDSHGQAIQHSKGETYIMNTTPLEFYNLPNNKSGVIHFENFKLQPFKNTISPSPSPSPIVSKRVFLTSSAYNGDLKSAGSKFGLGIATSGLDGADKVCQGTANIAKLGGTWKTWLSDSITSASSRLTHSSSPYKLLNGVIVANNWSDLIDGTIQNPINVSELGSLRVSTGKNYVWSDTDKNGNKITVFADPNEGNRFFNCQNWTALYGSTGTSFIGYGGAYTSTSSNWTFDDLASLDCQRDLLPLYCFEQ